MRRLSGLMLKCALALRGLVLVRYSHERLGSVLAATTARDAPVAQPFPSERWGNVGWSDEPQSTNPVDVSGMDDPTSYPGRAAGRGFG